MLPAATVKAAPISGWFWPGLGEDLSPAEQGWCSPSKFPDYENKRTNCTVIESNYRGLINLIQAYLQPGCVTALDVADSWKCYTMHVNAQYIKTPLFIAENRFDSVQINGDGELSPSQEGTSSGLAYLAYYGRAMNASIQQFLGRKKDTALFMPSCLKHCTNMGISAKVLLRQLVDGSSIVCLPRTSRYTWLTTVAMGCVTPRVTTRKEILSLQIQ